MKRSPKSKIYRFLSKLAVVSGFVLLLSTGVFTKTPAEYKKNVETANDLISELYYADAEEYSTIEEYRNFERETIISIRQNLPVAENIEWQGATVQTGNQWMTDRLGEYEKEEIGSSRREMILTEISERLDSLEAKLSELETAAASDRSKDENKRKLREILNREEYLKPEQEESWIQSLTEKIKEWLFAESPEKKTETPARTGYPNLSYTLVFVVLAAVLGLVGFLIYKFSPLLSLNLRPRMKKEKKERYVLGERLAADENAVTLFTDAERLAREGNLKQAIRKGYIALLCELSDRKIIGLAQHKTNRDYLRDVGKRREIHQDMNALTDNFERHWYGFENVEEKDWEEFRTGYEKVVSSRS